MVTGEEEEDETKDFGGEEEEVLSPNTKVNTKSKTRRARRVVKATPLVKRAVTLSSFPATVSAVAVATEDDSGSVCKLPRL